MRIAIVGTRPKFVSHPEWWERCVRRYVSAKLGPGDMLVSGGASGPDTWAMEEAAIVLGAIYKREHPEEHAVEYLDIDQEPVIIVYEADWSKGRGAGFARNLKIIANCDRVVAFWDGKSKGTQHTINLAYEHQREVEIINPRDYLPADWIEPAMFPF